MIRAEVKTTEKSFVFCEEIVEECMEYIEALIANGVDVVSVEYFDNDERVRAIRAGEV